ncbi:PAQR family membrane homeostasis protein TrhA [Vreelandella utahensis]|uniref:PAQR family membrane homeostasis protein TrhA n=1 Tax=Vreelandella halophila TaxID=86177 RepID=UPI000984D9D1|nr:hemolysin III family protein [Halomonas utahensis]
MTNVDFHPVEEVWNALTHGLGAVLALAGTIVLVVLAAVHGDVWSITSASVYGVSMVVLFLASTLYHSARRPTLRRAFKMFDHCAIFLLIAGTYTPFLLVNMRGTLGWTLFAIIWGLAVVGIVFKLVFGHRYKALEVGTFLVMGWLVVVAATELPAILGVTELALLVAGGLSYTVGVVFYLLNRIPYNHAIWHLFVLAGGALHYFAVYNGFLTAWQS